jgi:hypothetical protein
LFIIHAIPAVIPAVSLQGNKIGFTFQIQWLPVSILRLFFNPEQRNRRTRVRWKFYLAGNHLQLYSILGYGHSFFPAMAVEKAALYK